MFERTKRNIQFIKDNRCTISAIGGALVGSLVTYRLLTEPEPHFHRDVGKWGIGLTEEQIQTMIEDPMTSYMAHTPVGEPFTIVQLDRTKVMY